ncbi:required for meiotic nuclear division protein 1-like [Tropilaelaps mercedesae]|uniref:Required for meiotic nuclear division protein 1-like n=1 Tax=Tropilaelaps mercedesae TaxID=418985 RepID=A0A1V9Y0Z0_9ACAR|nr:required for meiotic nuclear division protein 1-like [Tropilaelaps mercedesae]
MSFALSILFLKEPNVLAYATCEEYNLEAIRKALTDQGLYRLLALPEESNAIHARAEYLVNQKPRNIFFFEAGSVVFWNFTKSEAKSVLQFLRPFEQDPYREDMIEDEVELMEFKLRQRTRIHNDKIELRRIDEHLQEKQLHLTISGLKSEGEETTSIPREKQEPALNASKGPEGHADPLEMYAFSNGVALSVKLAIWEATLEEYVVSLESILKDIENGRKLSVTRQHVFRKTGELFSLRHRLNLSSDLLDIPDFYWDRDDLEAHFLKTLKLYSIARRTQVMNEKIQHCQELMELVSHHLEDKHHVRLELMIIILIIVEVIFECVHYVERYSHSEVGISE